MPFLLPNQQCRTLKDTEREDHSQAKWTTNWQLSQGTQCSLYARESKESSRNSKTERMNDSRATVNMRILQYFQTLCCVNKNGSSISNPPSSSAPLSQVIIHTDSSALSIPQKNNEHKSKLDSLCRFSHRHRTDGRHNSRPRELLLKKCRTFSFFFVPGDLWAPNSNSGEIFVQCT